MGRMAEIIVRMAAPEETEIIRDLFRQYQADIGVDLCFQSFEDELAHLPGKYEWPSGVMLIALLDRVPVGCAAVRLLNDGACELKRLYVSSVARGSGIGSALLEKAIEFANEAGYERMLLDTLPPMERAIAMYRARGFRETEPYTDTPSALWFELRLKNV